MGAFGVGVWKHIRKAWDSFSNFVLFEVGVGSKVTFWHENWCGYRLLKQVFPTLLAIARHKDKWVADNFQCQDGFIQWNILFMQPD
jgi:hypothetical protein